MNKLDMSPLSRECVIADGAPIARRKPALAHGGSTWVRVRVRNMSIGHVLGKTPAR